MLLCCLADVLQHTSLNMKKEKKICKEVQVFFFSEHVIGMEEDITARCKKNTSYGVAGASSESRDEDSFNSADTCVVSDVDDQLCLDICFLCKSYF